MGKINVGFVGTEKFYNKGYGSSELDDMLNTCKSIWQSEIEDGSGDYEAEFYVYDQSWVEIPENEIDQYSSTRDRVQEADKWLKNNWSLQYYNIHVIIIGDSINNYGYNRGVAQQTAGTQDKRCCLLDMGQIVSQTNDPDSPWRNLGYAGVAAHELLHMFLDNNNDEHEARINNGDGTIQYDPQSTEWCWKYGDLDLVVEQASYCTENNVCNWIDNHQSRFN